MSTVYDSLLIRRVIFSQIIISASTHAGREEESERSERTSGKPGGWAAEAVQKLR